MVSVDTYETPRYTRDHFAYYKQVCEWYLDIDQFQNELLAFHIDRTKHFQNWLAQTEKTNGNRPTVTFIDEY